LETDSARYFSIKKLRKQGNPITRFKQALKEFIQAAEMADFAPKAKARSAIRRLDIAVPQNLNNVLSTVGSLTRVSINSDKFTRLRSTLLRSIQPDRSSIPVRFP
jgi:hypothetical protein